MSTENLDSPATFDPLFRPFEHLLFRQTQNVSRSIGFVEMPYRLQVFSSLFNLSFKNPFLFCSQSVSECTKVQLVYFSITYLPLQPPFEAVLVLFAEC